MGRDERPDLRAVLERVVALDDAGEPIAALTHLVAALRPATSGGGEAQVLALCDRLQAGDEATRRALADVVRRAVGGASCVHTLTESGIPADRGFFDELLLKVGRRALPEVEDPRELREIVRAVFPDRKDYAWLAAVSEATWHRLLDLLGLTADTVVGVPAELASAVRVLAHHVSSLGLSPEITGRMPELDDLDSPFLLLTERVLRYTQRCGRGDPHDTATALTAALETLEACRAAVVALRANKHRFGTSLRLTSLSFRLLRQVERLEVLLRLTAAEQRAFERAVQRLLVELVEAENTRDRVGRHVRSSADLLAFQIVEHAAKKGHKYITNTAAEYWRFFVASLGGGLIVAVFAVFKLLLAKEDLSLAAEALLYSLNYAACFIVIYLTGAALATKQPAMTANTIARSLGAPEGRHELDQVADMIVRVWRSQFVSFAGNLVCAFPMAVLLSELFVTTGGAPLASPDKATALLADVHPWLSGALFYAGVAGVFLFLAGLVSGWADNRNLYRDIPARVAHHPLLRRLVGRDRAAGLGAFVDKHGGALLGNVFLGFCLGGAGTLGVILGLPFDIRHIAFSSANVGMALDGLAWQVPGSVVLEAALGVVLIGFVNFVISFGLTLSLALESRRITLREHKAVAGLVLRRLARRPWHFFLPPRRASST